MKPLLLILLLTSFSKPPASILKIDTEFKKPISSAADFTIDDYFKRTFPIYAADLASVIQATEKVVKKLEQEAECFSTDTVRANRTTFIIFHNCENLKGVSVRVNTRVNEQNAHFDFELVRSEGNRRKAQRRLLEFSSYLEKESIKLPGLKTGF
jgi:hypothetical protein